MSGLLWTLRRHALTTSRAAAAVLGLPLVVFGIVLLFTTANSTRALFLVAAGVALVLLAVFARRIRIESFEVLGAQVAVRDVVGERLRIAESEERSADDARHQAVALRKLGELYELYAFMRRTQPPGRRRTGGLDQVAATVRQAVRDTWFDPTEVSAWFRDGTDELRFVSLNVMIARPDCRDFIAALEGIESSRSAFEQFYALWLAAEMVTTLEPVERAVLADTVSRALRRRRMRGDAARASVARRILASLEA